MLRSISGFKGWIWHSGMAPKIRAARMIPILRIGELMSSPKRSRGC